MHQQAASDISGCGPQADRGALLVLLPLLIAVHCHCFEQNPTCPFLTLKMSLVP